MRGNLCLVGQDLGQLLGLAQARVCVCVSTQWSRGLSRTLCGIFPSCSLLSGLQWRFFQRVIWVFLGHQDGTGAAQGVSSLHQAVCLPHISNL